MEMAKKHMKRCSKPLFIGKMQIKTTHTHTHSTALYLSEWLFSKEQHKTSVGKDVERREPSCTIYWWDCNLMSLLLKMVWRFLKKFKKIELPYNPAILLLSIYLRKRDTNFKRGMYPSVHCSMIYSSQDVETV